MFVYLLGIIFLLSQNVASLNKKSMESPNLAENSLWNDILRNCSSNFSKTCIQKNLQIYLKSIMTDWKDIKVTNSFKFTKNNISASDISRSFQENQFENNTINNKLIGTSSNTYISQLLHETSVNFLLTHDMELKLPKTLFDESILIISPRSLTEDGALINLHLIPKDPSEGRLFFKKIKKFISEKLIMALLAILLVIKLLAVKFLFFAPLMVGAVTAKKLLIKLLLFIFPALHHFFKLCPYVPHGVKYHHHKHNINHIHQIGHHKPHLYHHRPHHESVEIIAPHKNGPPTYSSAGSHHHFVDEESPDKYLYNPHETPLEYGSEGPAFTDHFISHRKDNSKEEVPNDILPWSQEPQKIINGAPTPAEIENMILKAEKEALIKSRLQQEKKRIQAENAKLAEQLKYAIKIQNKLKHQQTSLTPIPGSAKEELRPFSQQATLNPKTEDLKVGIKTQSPFLKTSVVKNLPLWKPNQNQISEEQINVHQKYHTPYNGSQRNDFIDISSTTLHPKTSNHEVFENALYKAAIITYDKFYSPILSKIDSIINGLGVFDEPCRERLICRMYKNPEEYSPHSNLLSVQLSRDPNELQKSSLTNAAVIRFYRYVQAARDGQDRRDCSRLYVACSATKK